MEVIKAPKEFDLWSNRLPHLFLSGPMANADNWQQKVIEFFKETDCVILNPCRDNWVYEKLKAQEQFLWELSALEECSIKGWVLIYLHPATRPATAMLHLGMITQKVLRNVIVVCPDGFYRKEEVEILCEKRILPFYNTLEEGLEKLKELMFAKNH